MFFIYPVSWDINTFPNFGHFWSLAVEEHFYLFWPLLIYFSKNNILKFMLIVFVFSMLCWILGFFIPFFNWTTLKYASVLSVGGIIAYYEIYHIEVIKVYYRKYKKYLMFIFILLLLSSFIPRKFGDVGEFVMFLVSLYFFSTLVIVTIFSNKKRNIFSNSTLIFLGKISYGIYVYHGMFRPYFKIWFYEPLYTSFSNGIIVAIIYTIISTIISVAIAYISWELFEKHMIKLKKYFTYKKDKNV
jgi:peptidoglycan/LPS O-acetylase OafA/YrhL